MALPWLPVCVCVDAKGDVVLALPRLPMCADASGSRVELSSYLNIHDIHIYIYVCTRKYACVYV